MTYFLIAISVLVGCLLFVGFQCWQSMQKRKWISFSLYAGLLLFWTAGLAITIGEATGFIACDWVACL